MRTRGARWDLPDGVVGLDTVAASVGRDLRRPVGGRLALTAEREALMAAARKGGQTRARNRRAHAKHEAELRPLWCRGCGEEIPYTGGDVRDYRRRKTCGRAQCAATLSEPPPVQCLICREHGHRTSRCPLGTIARPRTMGEAPDRCDRCGGPWRYERLTAGRLCWSLACVTCGRRLYAEDQVREGMLG